MPDVIQRAVERLALHNTVARAVIILCASVLVYLLGLAWVVVAGRHRWRMTLRTVVRVLALGVLVALGSKVLTP